MHTACWLVRIGIGRKGGLSTGIGIKVSKDKYRPAPRADSPRVISPVAPSEDRRVAPWRGGKVRQTRPHVRVEWSVGSDEV
jgi:hypothetical protein